MNKEAQKQVQVVRAEQQPKRILIVEDDASIVDVLCNLLEFIFGQQDLHVAKDGQDGLRKAHEVDPQLILMDLSLPKMSGWDVTRCLKSNPRFKEVPILAMTAHAMIGDREKALEAGCNDYYAKPIEVDEFVHFMRPYLSV
jgi:two-component system cell cycle response regulator DivK